MPFWYDFSLVFLKNRHFLAKIKKKTSADPLPSERPQIWNFYLQGSIFALIVQQMLVKAGNKLKTADRTLNFMQNTI